MKLKLPGQWQYNIGRNMTVTQDLVISYTAAAFSRRALTNQSALSLRDKRGTQWPDTSRDYNVVRWRELQGLQPARQEAAGQPLRGRDLSGLQVTTSRQLQLRSSVLGVTVSQSQCIRVTVRVTIPDSYCYILYASYAVIMTRGEDLYESGCRAFFRRAKNRKRTLRCSANRDCSLGLSTEKLCRHCRYEKCIR